ncbi:arginine--tRNA ligase [Neptunitalea lumnitzerae]|uniref:Arginine--tRNA ligase n=1 Tax=Neptunitalea lumnitzerae TaxID=2965509 RepID=A0ABQ5MHK0_9FLAO|nr:arginine--tRNA ligase [Neptunitalea sp. Y10]GLB48868.1 arginine--tRNA ligase [Neptunitalea sp. Y10]
MNIQELLTQKVQEAVKVVFDVALETVEFQATRKEFAGDITVVVFPMLRFVKGNPQVIGEQIGTYLKEHVTEVNDFNVVKGFLNLVIDDSFYINFFNDIKDSTQFGLVTADADAKAVMVEYSSPNTNKPLHLGHIRNNLLGYSVAEILGAAGNKVYKTQIINDRGIHICKSMLAWQKFGAGETPASTGLKGDKLVGNYYVKFDVEYKKEIAALVAEGKSKEEAEKQAPLLLEAQEMLRKWEAGDAEVVALWKTMNEWVYDGFAVTYKNLGVDFDSYYYESNTYLLGKEFVAEGLEKGVFYKKEDGSVWCDLTDEGLDEKIVLRADGTAVYMTQDIGTAIQRVKDHPDVGGMVYTVGNEQDYHFKVLFLILKKLGFDWAEKLYHLSYGMVDLPSGKMKSREGTVVDADDLVEEMATTAEEISKDLGKLDGFSEEEKKELYKTIGLGALKYYILKVDPKKRILFDPKESIDFQGNTGPFIQYTHARIQSILRKADFNLDADITGVALHEKEKELLKQLQLFPEVIQNAADNYSPALIANYIYDLVKEFNSFYQNVSILGEEDEQLKVFRVLLAKLVGLTIKNGFALLGIQVPDRM